MDENSSSDEPPEPELREMNNSYGQTVILKSLPANIWGKSVHIDLDGCNDYVDDPEKIQEFIDKLVKEINMKKYGVAHIEHFGSGNLLGYSVMQFIETSSITGHFDVLQGNQYRAFLDIFSCKDFDENKALEFCKNFFNAKNARIKVLLRR